MILSLNDITSANLDGVFELMTKSRHRTRHRTRHVLMVLAPTACEKETVFAHNPEITNFINYIEG